MNTDRGPRISLQDTATMRLKALSRRSLVISDAAVQPIKGDVRPSGKKLKVR
jgi:hypothetical protein